MIKLKVSAANIAVEEKETLTEGRVGLMCRFSFTGEWDGLAKTAVFDGADSRDVILTEDTVAVPAECLAAEGYSLSVGVYGKNAAGDIVIPTVYATVGKIQRSAYPAGKEAAPPTPDVVAQIQQAAANAEAMARAVREDAELGKFKGEPGEPGGWYTPEIRQPIKKSMVVNFIPSKEGMPAAEPKLILLPEGEPGGWYTPEVTQPDANTMRVSFTPSKEGMPAVDPADIAIPTGGGSGTSGEDGGYYTPEVTQTSENTMQVAFSPSKTSMPAVSGTEIMLPAGQKGDKGDTGPAGADGKSAYAYAAEGGYTGTESEFAAKLAAEKFANPNALTFTGAVTGSYDGSAALSVEIPSGGGGTTEKAEKVYTIEENVAMFTIPASDFDPAIYPAVQIAFSVPAGCKTLEVGMTRRGQTCKIPAISVTAEKSYHLLFIGMDNLNRNIPLAVGYGQNNGTITWKEAPWYGYNDGKANGFYLNVSSETPFPAGAMIRVRSV